MKKISDIFGRMLFWATWPLLYIYLRIGRRTRVLIRHNDELLVVKGWLGSDNWIFPGGGLHRGEDPAEGAVREVFEETGLKLDPKRLTFIFEREIISPQKMRFTCLVYGIDINSKPELKAPRHEITAISWQPISELLAQPAAELLVKPALEEWNDLR